MNVDAPSRYNHLLSIYDGSDGDATKALYAELERLGPAGFIAVNLFRAHKSSGRAKVYRGRGFRGMAYDRKQWSIENLCAVLTKHGEALGLVWGWRVDPATDGPHRFVFYIELPTGQVSFHSDRRGDGPDFPHDWDGVRMAGPGRICRWIERLLREPQDASLFVQSPVR